MTPPKTPQKNQNARLTSIALSTLIGLSLSACAFSENPGAGTPPPVKPGDVLDTLQTEKDKEATDGVLTSENVSITFEENPTPGSYQMIIQWPTNIRHVTINVNSGLPLIVRNSDRASIAVESGKPHKIQIVAYGAVSSSPLSSLELSADSPLDAIYDKEVRLVSATTIKAHRVFFKPSAHLILNGNSLNIETEKLYASTDNISQADGIPFANAAHIATNIIGTNAAKETDLNGSVVTIVAKKAYGHLMIAMIGVDGRDGISGEDVEKAMVPPPSRVARVDPLLNGTPGIEEQVGRRCKPGYDSDTTGCGPAKACTKPPSNGKDGAKGDRGTPAGLADNGGSYGNLFILIEDYSALRLDGRWHNGKPGDGKPGAPGFPGVIGGRAGDAPGICSELAAKAGANGPAGDKGDDSKDGETPTTGSAEPLRAFNSFRPLKVEKPR